MKECLELEGLGIGRVGDVKISAELMSSQRHDIRQLERFVVDRNDTGARRKSYAGRFSKTRDLTSVETH